MRTVTSGRDRIASEFVAAEPPGLPLPVAAGGAQRATEPVSWRGLVGNAAIYTLANVTNSAIPFLLLPVLTRVLSPEEYGLVTIFATSAAC